MEQNYRKKVRIAKIVFVTIDIIIFLIMLGVSFKLYSSDTSNLLINLMIAFFMESVLSLGSTSIFKTYALQLDLMEAKKQIQHIYKEQNGNIDCEVVFSKFTFSSDILRNEYEQYKQEYRRLKEKYPETKQCDINDYLNEELIDLHIYKNLTDLIPGILTALGIAGTFLGLMIGLSDFKIDNVDIDQMQLNISLLLNGIKTAFLTSIFGVILSLIFNGIYRLFYYNAEKALNEFTIEFEKFIPSMSTSVINEMINYSRSQLTITETIGDVIADKVSDALKPAISSLGEMANEFKNHVISTHDESLEKIVDAFVNNMNESLGNQFKTLGLTIEELNNSQISNAEKIQTSINHICETSDKLSEINEMLNSAINNLRDYTSQINDYQAAVTHASSELCDNVKSFSEASKSQNILIENMLGEQKNIIGSVNGLKEYIDISVTHSREYLNSIESITTKNKELLESQAISTEKYLSEAFAKTDSILQSITDTYIKNKDNISDAASELVNNCTEATNQQLAATKEILTQLSNDAKNIVNQINTDSEEHTQKLLKLFEEVIKRSEETLERQTEQSLNIQNALNNSINDSVKSIKHSFRELDDNIERMLTNTFSTFDTSLTDISATVSGTILNTKENVNKLNLVTENIPETVYQIYDNMSKAMNENIKREFDRIFKDCNAASKALSAFNDNAAIICSEMKKTAESLAKISKDVVPVGEV